MTKNLLQILFVSMVGAVLTITSGTDLYGLRAEQQPGDTQMFRVSADIVVVDVGVVDRAGYPVTELEAADFRVTIGGRRREVTSVEFVASDARAGRRPEVGDFPAGAVVPADGVPQIFMLAIDTASFDFGASRGVANAAQEFVDQLAGEAYVGVFSFPLGPKLDPTRERSQVADALSMVTGQRPQQTGRFSVRSSELVDISAGDRDVFSRVRARECGVPSGSCGGELETHIRSLALSLEAQLIGSYTMVRDLFRAMGSVPARKTVVLFSAGHPASDRPGGRPDVGDLPFEVGASAASGNINLYTIFIDTDFLRLFSAETRGGAERRPVNLARNEHVSAHLLDLLSGSAGGAFLKVLVGSGESALERVLRETSAFYLLGVDVEEADRDGEPHEIEVEVPDRDLTVRSRKWVVIPSRSE